ncbi:MAG: B12-binding domain-containing radical SAM protein [Myxococcota bacterium]
MTKVLLTTPVGPYDTHYYNHSLTDVMDQRFSRGCGIFTLRGHIHINFAHVLAQNIEAPSVFLEYPTQEAFEDELRKQYDVVGINGFHNQRDVVIDMCKRVRELAPESRILLGGWSAVGIKHSYPESEWKQFADAICEGEGVSFLRKELGENPNRPVSVSHLPKCAASIPWLEPHPRGDMGTVVASLGCPNGCDFCGTTHMFSKKRLRVLAAEQAFKEFKRYYRESPNILSVNLIEEDSFADRPFMERLGELIQGDEEFGLGKMGFFCLSANNSLSKWDWDDIVKTGVSTIFIGVESKFAPQEGYGKRKGRTIEETFEGLHSRGIATIGAWMCGFDFQTRENMEEDLQNFISLEPTYQQLTRLCPFPGTPLWERLTQEGRIDPAQVPVESISFFGGGGMKPKHFYEHEIMEIIDRGYRLLYETWGASFFRQWKVLLNGFEYCKDHPDPKVRERAEYHRKMSTEMYPLTLAMEVYAPNATVRKLVRDQRQRYERLLGPVSKGQRLVQKLVLNAARKAAEKELHDPVNASPKQEPFKRYEYHKQDDDGECPYTVTHPHRELSYTMYDMRRRARERVVGAAIDAFGKVSKLAGMAPDVKGLDPRYQSRRGII